MTVSVQQPPPDWVPVEHRWFGIDRRTFKPAVIVLVVALVLIYGLQTLNAVIPWHNEIKAGDVLDLGDGATAVPPVGWQLVSGTLAGGSATSLDIVLTKGGATIELRGASFGGTAGAFLDQVDRAEGDGLTGSRGTVTTESGLVGVLQSTESPSSDGLDAAFRMSAAAALLFRVRTSPGQFEQYRDEVVTVLRSITPAVTR